MKKFWRAVRAATWVKRSGLEQFLILLSAGLIGGVVLLVIALVREHAPMEPEWGNVADWVAAGVTFLGFAGAIAALRVQVKSVDAQLEQHNTAKEAAQEEQKNKIAADAQAAEHERRRVASEVNLSIEARRHEPDREIREHPFVVRCVLAFPRGGTFTEVEFKVPEKPEGFEVIQDNIADLQKEVVQGGSALYWVVSGAVWPHGDEEGASAWVTSRTSAKFTDPAGVQWMLDGDGQLTDIRK